MRHDLIISHLLAVRSTIEALIAEVEEDRQVSLKAATEGSPNIETFDGGKANGTRQTE